MSDLFEKRKASYLRTLLNRWGVTPFAARPAVTAATAPKTDLQIANVTAVYEISMIFPSIKLVTTDLNTSNSFPIRVSPIQTKNKMADFFSSDGLEPSTPPKT